MAELANCSSCGKVFVKALRPICNDCNKEVDGKFQIVYDYLRKRENRSASLHEVHKDTEVEIDLIYKFIREGRIHLRDFPNLGYPCEKCEALIREGKLCTDCQNDIRSGLNGLKSQKEFEDRKKSRENQRITTYSSLGDRLKR
ncbi:TIGR03826 family flagellar region protein [Evansella sp. AB-rgal1]|uniref:TIGR03826 family flagellar region protein n=1 Tax=Evansella sp. AB-rgal1 TaxID=3242696 RepID=UPI00359D6007